MQKINPFNKKIIYIHGLYACGKSRMLYLMDKHDHFKDLCLSLDNISKSNNPRDYLTDNVIRVRGGEGLMALSIPLHNLPLARKIFIEYKYSYPVKNIVIDEVEHVSLQTLKNLLIMLQQEFPHVKSIVLAGILSNNSHGVPFHTCEYLAQHCKTIYIKCHCQFCNRIATHILLIYKKKPLTLRWSQYFQYKDHLSERQIMHLSNKYYVCKYHLLNPPMKRILITKPHFTQF